jgi:hypothetical protein
MIVRRYPSIALLLALLAVAGCSTISVNHDYDTQADFTAYRTFAWMERDAGQPADAQQAQQNSGLLDRRIRSAVERELTERGMTAAAADQADVHLVYHVGTEDKLQVTDWGYSYSNYYWGYGGRQIDVYQYTQGTLIIDVVDNARDSLVWRGSGTKTIESRQLSPEEQQARIDQAVYEIMKSFPPK